ncbi:hypothetical protein SERLADRAFT_365020 [Serpula lacrymans var. lacrymans S7.9]|uniref:Carboxypeptidase n=1 Tax=Serpula lacrymans var. lacrymans (strain S7.9) TaxID=578457 RepID=F8NFR8_SERL9|nr:uncharacterized protein SERLADRAFT_365020 [Serpula lacrymans var. lacrymans S7.9]EGO31276.1 hypothetical protein SERLADRAFT_365020 [Serpula lacrymans var. lacrymans S7.9]
MAEKLLWQRTLSISNDRTVSLVLALKPYFVKLRITEPQLCNPTVQQYSRYLDISEGKHLFFWFFESRSSPSEDPLLLWLNGGPGCSFSTGLLFELGPCSVVDEGNNTTYNPHSWYQQANIIFLDQPIDVGFSYSTDGSQVTTSPEAAKDVYAFLELFVRRFPKYADAPFHLAAESYGGRFLPHIASEIHKKQGTQINLASVMVGNGLVDPRTQMPSVVEYACEGPYAIYDDPFGSECTRLRISAAVCERLIEGCYRFESRLTCIPASVYCWNSVFGPVFSHDQNMYDARKQCKLEENGSLCYKEMIWAEKWMNESAAKLALGVNPSRFAKIRGKEKFVSNLDNIYRKEFLAVPSTLWSTSNGAIVGEVRSADMVLKWVHDVPLA